MANNTSFDFGDNIRWAFGTVDISGFERDEPLYSGVLMESEYLYTGRTELVVRRIEGGDHAAALSLELGTRARSWFEETDVASTLRWEDELSKNPTEYELAG